VCTLKIMSDKNNVKLEGQNSLDCDIMVLVTQQKNYLLKYII